MNDQLASILIKFGFEESLIAEIQTAGRLKRIGEGKTLISPDDQSGEVPIVLRGVLKVVRQDPDGQEVFLYFLEGGDTCAMSITCCLEGKRASIRVEAEEDSELWMIPSSNMDRWVTRYQSFRKFVFASYQARFDELLSTIDSVVFTKLDQRLYKYLLDAKQATGSFEINKTHEQIAKELNSSRVVISRLLKQLEKEEKIEQHRNKIEIL